LRRKRAVRFGLLFVCCLVFVGGFLLSRAIFEAERLHAALVKINKAIAESGVESLTRSDLESIIGRPPDFVLPPATDSADGLTELYWARVAAQSQDEATLEAVELELLRRNADSVEKAPGAVLENIILHGYVKQDGTVFWLIGDDAPRDFPEYILEKVNRWVFAYSNPAPPPAPPSTLTYEAGPHERAPDPHKIPIRDSSLIDRMKCVTVGAVIISGNDRTPDNVILKLFGVGGGSTISGEQLQAVAERLVDSGLFVVDPPRDIRPRVQVLDLDSDKQFKDVLITITERK
jgi:Surface antigen variable number repeat